MADDIKITTGLQGQNSKAGAQPASKSAAQFGNQNAQGGAKSAAQINPQFAAQAGSQASAQMGSQAAQSQSAQTRKIPETPVIDLRTLDTNMPGPPPALGNKNATAQPIASSVSNATPGAINLEEAALLGAQTTVAAPQQKYVVPDIVKQKFPDLIDLVKSTESMNDEERDYWFQILPIMTEDQIKKFYDILQNEKKQLAHLDTQYEQELNRLNQKHLLEWKEFEAKEKRKALKEAEARSAQEEKQAEEDLLARLSQV